MFETHHSMKVVNGTEARPATSGAAQEKWDQQSSDAFTAMLFSMEDDQVEAVSGCTSAQEVWKKLATMYESSSGENKQILWQDFYGVKCESSPVKTMCEIQNLAAQLRSLGVTVDDEAIVARVISSMMDERFRQFREAWRSVDIVKQTSSLLLSRLKVWELEEQQEMKSSLTDDSSQRAFRVGQNKPKRTREEIEKLKKVTRCHKCSELGHWARECPNDSDDSEENSDEESERSSEDESDDDSEEEEENSKVSQSSRSRRNNHSYALGCDDDLWFNDSGTKRHCCGKREWFTEFKKYTKPKLLKLADGKPVEVLGKGTVPIKALANGIWTEVNLVKVQYIPGGANLFSENAMWKRGFYIYKNSNRKTIEFRRTKQGKAELTGRFKNGMQIMNFVPVQRRAIIPDKSQKCGVDNSVQSNLKAKGQTEVTRSFAVIDRSGAGVKPTSMSLWRIEKSSTKTILETEVSEVEFKEDVLPSQSLNPEHFRKRMDISKANGNCMKKSWDVQRTQTIPLCKKVGRNEIANEIKSQKEIQKIPLNLDFKQDSNRYKLEEDSNVSQFNLSANLEEIRGKFQKMDEKSNTLGQHDTPVSNQNICRRKENILDRSDDDQIRRKEFLLERLTISKQSQLQFVDKTKKKNEDDILHNQILVKRSKLNERRNESLLTSVFQSEKKEDDIMCKLHNGSSSCKSEPEYLHNILVKPKKLYILHKRSKSSYVNMIKLENSDNNKLKDKNVVKTHFYFDPFCFESCKKYREKRLFVCSQKQSQRRKKLLFDMIMMTFAILYLIAYMSCELLQEENMQREISKDWNRNEMNGPLSHKLYFTLLKAEKCLVQIQNFIACKMQKKLKAHYMFATAFICRTDGFMLMVKLSYVICTIPYIREERANLIDDDDDRSKEVNFFVKQEECNESLENDDSDFCQKWQKYEEKIKEDKQNVFVFIWKNEMRLVLIALSPFLLDFYYLFVRIWSNGDISKSKDRTDGNGHLDISG